MTAQSSLITAFFKSPAVAEGGEDKEEDRFKDASSCKADDDILLDEEEIRYNDDEYSRSSMDSVSGGLNLNGLLNGMTSSHVTHLPSTSEVMENGTTSLSPSPCGSSIGHHTMLWDTSDGTLCLRPPTMIARQDRRRRRQVQIQRKELVVRIKKCFLCRVPNKDNSLHSKLESENVMIDSDCEEVVQHNLVHETRSDNVFDKSLEIISISSPPTHNLSPLNTNHHPHQVTTSLSTFWAKIFKQPHTKPSSLSSTADTTIVDLDSKSICSPKKNCRRRSASCSPCRPISRSPRHPISRSRPTSRSPRASPRRCSPLQSPRKGTSSAPSSPLKISLLPRKLAPYITPSVAKRQRLEFDHAPFSNLVHVQQINNTDPLWTLTSAKPLFNFKTDSNLTLEHRLSDSNLTLEHRLSDSNLTLEHRLSDSNLTLEHRLSDSNLTLEHRLSESSLKSCLNLSPDEINIDHTPILTPVTSTSQQTAILNRLVEKNPLVRVKNIYQRYSQLKNRNSTQSLLKSERGSYRKPLICSIHILNDVNKTSVEVDVRAYNTRRKASLRLSRKRGVASTDCPSLQNDGVTANSKRRKTISSTSTSDDVRESGDMWTEVYRPQTGRDMIGNKVAIQRLLEWLKTWRTKCSQRQQPTSDQTYSVKTEKKRNRRTNSSELNGNKHHNMRERSPTPEWAQGCEDFISLRHLKKRRQRKKVVLRDSSCSESEEEERDSHCDDDDDISSVLLLCGDVGCGKTAAVHACATELGYKIFEVNATSLRSRGSLLATLKEATLSHQVSTQPTPLSQNLKELNMTTTGSQLASEKRVKDVSKTTMNGLFSFFKPLNQKQDKKKMKKKTSLTREEGSNGGQSHTASVSLESITVILLEEVDVLFESDKGFWSGVYDLIATTKRPIILTCNDSRYDLDCDHIKIIFDSPSLTELGVHMQLLCLSHDYHMTSDMAVQLADHLHVDIRRIFLTLQFWTTTNITTTSQTSLELMSALRLKATASPFLPPRQMLPWQPLKPHPPSSDCYRDIDMASHHAEQCSYLDLVSKETRSCDSHMTHDIKPWWSCTEDTTCVIDELPMRECLWREDEMICGVCDEIERTTGERMETQVDKTNFITRVENVCKCLERCTEVFGHHSNHVGVATDGLPFLRTICSTEYQRCMNNTKRRFRHYLQMCTVDQSDLQNLSFITRFTSSNT